MKPMKSLTTCQVDSLVGLNNSKMFQVLKRAIIIVWLKYISVKKGDLKVKFPFGQMVP